MEGFCLFHVLSFKNYLKHLIPKVKLHSEVCPEKPRLRPVLAARLLPPSPPRVADVFIHFWFITALLLFFAHKSEYVCVTVSFFLEDILIDCSATKVILKKSYHHGNGPDTM